MYSLNYVKDPGSENSDMHYILLPQTKYFGPHHLKSFGGSKTFQNLFSDQQRRPTNCTRRVIK